MPINPEFKHHYGPEWRKVIRPRILARAEHRCEQCDAPNHEFVLRGFSGDFPGAWRLDKPKEGWRDGIGSYIANWEGPARLRTVRIVLGVAHLNHTPGDNRDENLKALCQWCHFAHDQEHHAESRAIRKDHCRPILQKLEALKLHADHVPQAMIAKSLGIIYMGTPNGENAWNYERTSNCSDLPRGEHRILSCDRRL